MDHDHGWFGRGLTAFRHWFLASAILAACPVFYQTTVAHAACCTVCGKGQPCGDSCISKKKKCHKGKGCACGPDEAYAPSNLFRLATSNAALSQSVRIIDGDSLELNGETIRLEGIDAPEMRQDCKDASGATYRCGRSARLALERMAQGVITCTPSGKDHYSRTLAYCATAKADINRRMAQDGWAFAFVKYNDRYLSEEFEARIAGRGMWSGEVQAPWDWRAAQIADYGPPGACKIKGNVRDGRRTYYMPFHQVYKRVKIEEAKGERWLCTEDEALAAGWERSKR